MTSATSAPTPMIAARITAGWIPVKPTKVTRATIPLANCTWGENCRVSATTTLRIKETWNPDAAKAWARPVRVKGSFTV